MPATTVPRTASMPFQMGNRGLFTTVTTSLCSVVLGTFFVVWAAVHADTSSSDGFISEDCSGVRDWLLVTGIFQLITAAWCFPHGLVQRFCHARLAVDKRFKCLSLVLGRFAGGFLGASLATVCFPSLFIVWMSEFNYNGGFASGSDCAALQHVGYVWCIIGITLFFGMIAFFLIYTFTHLKFCKKTTASTLSSSPQVAASGLLEDEKAGAQYSSLA